MNYLNAIGMGLGFIIWNWSPFGDQVFADEYGTSTGMILLVVFIAIGYGLGGLVAKEMNKN